MDDLLSEKEQLDQFRSWWSEYGAYVIGGIVIGAGLLFGINHYQTATLQAQLEASAAFEALIDHVVDGDLEAAEAMWRKSLVLYQELGILSKVEKIEGWLLELEKDRG